MQNKEKTASPLVAFLDSGTGGIPYMLFLKQKCPDINCVYLGDTANFPYGEKTEEQVIACATNAVQLIIDRFAPAAVVVACNTMSVAALSALRKTFPDTPFVGTVPAVKLASSLSKNRRIGLLATSQAVKNPYTTKLIDDFASDCFVAKLGEPALISFIEKKLFTATEQEKIDAIMPSINFFKQNDVDCIVLGCTHFLHMAELYRETAEKVFEKPVLVVDSRDGVAKQTLRVLKTASETAAFEKSDFPAADMTFFMTGEKTPESQKEYKALSERLNIPYGEL